MADVRGDRAPSRVALVTGGGRGIGRELALGLAAHGLSVAVLGRHAASLEQVVRQCRDHGVPALPVVADVTDEDAVPTAVAKVVDAFGPIDLLVNNAGRADVGEVAFDEADLDDVLGVIEVNMIGPLRVLHAVLPGMRAAGRGRVLNVNSGIAFRREPGYTGYAVSKAALARTTDLLAHQLAEHGIVLVDVSPGLVRTDMTESMPMWTAHDDPPWGDARAIVHVARMLADGRLDSLSGRFVHASADDLHALLAAVPHDRSRRTLGLIPYGEGDPLA